MNEKAGIVKSREAREGKAGKELRALRGQAARGPPGAKALRDKRDLLASPKKKSYESIKT
jgi:hypothetical protein